MIKKPAKGKRLRGIDASACTKTVKKFDNSLEKFTPAQDSKDMRFQEFMNKELGITEENKPPEQKKKTPDVIKNLYKLPDNIDFDNYNKNREVLDRKHWLSGLAEVQADNSQDEGKITLNDISRSLGLENSHYGTSERRRRGGIYDFERIDMKEFDTSQFSMLTGKADKRHKRIMEKKNIEKKLKNKEYEEKHQKS